MINDYLKTGLPFYDNILKQDRYKDFCGCDPSLDCLFKLPAPNNALLPFQIEKKIIANDLPTQWKVHTLDGNVAMDISFNINKLQVIPGKPGYQNVIYDGSKLSFKYNNGEIVDLSICNGYYYSTVIFKSGTSYSEIFFVDDQTPLNRYLKIEWNGNCHIGGIQYSAGYKNMLYLDTELSKNVPSVIEDGEEIDGVFIPITVQYINNYRIECYVPEYLVEALISLSLHPNVVITLKNGLYSTKSSKINVTNIEWDETSCMAVVELKFQQDEQMIYKSCC